VGHMPRRWSGGGERKRDVGVTSKAVHGRARSNNVGRTKKIGGGMSATIGPRWGAEKKTIKKIARKKERWLGSGKSQVISRRTSWRENSSNSRKGDDETNKGKNV